MNCLDVILSFLGLSVMTIGMKVRKKQLLVFASVLL